MSGHTETEEKIILKGKGIDTVRKGGRILEEDAKIKGEEMVRSVSGRRKVYKI